MSTGIADEAAEALESDYSDETSTFGDRVTLAREALGLDQAALAEKLGVKLKTIRNWEDNRAEPRANKLQMLAGVLNVSMIWLLSGKGRLPQVVADATQQTIEECLNELQDIQAEQRRIADRMYALERRLRLSLDG